MKIQVKVVEVDVRNNAILLKFKSENSKHNIDHYDPIGFTIFATTTPYKTVEEYIKSIEKTIFEYVNIRDAAEKAVENVKYNSWMGYSTEIDVKEETKIDPYGPDHLAPGLTQHEVEL
jgi:hypothetical protein